MTDVQLLFLVLALIYGWECACWLNRDSVIIHSWLGRNWRVTHPGTLFGNQQGGFVFGHPLPPLGTLLTASEFPLVLSPNALGAAHFSDAYAPPAAKGKCFSWDGIERVDVNGKKIFLNRQLFLKAGSPSLATSIKTLLLEIRQAKPNEREGLIKQHLKKLFETSRIEECWRKFKSQTRHLPLATNALFVHLFILSPMLIVLLSFRHSWLVLLAVALVLTFTIAVLFHRAHKALFPTAEDERFTHFIIILLSPATAIRARDILARPLFDGCHPLALTKVFGSTQRLHDEARSFVRHGRYEVRLRDPQQEPLTQETERFWCALRQKTLEDFLKRSGVDPEQLVQAPAPADETCLSYCPLCQAQFTTREGICPDCNGLALRPLPHLAKAVR